MATYHYRIIDKEARVRTGTLDAPLKLFARQALLRDDSTILLLTALNSPLDRLRQIDIPLLGNGFSAMDEIMFYRNFSAMLGVGMPISSTLQVLSEQMKTRTGKKTIESIRKHVEGGKPLSLAMAEHKTHFVEHITETIRVGETTGDMVRTLEQISENLERDYEISRKVIGAIMYPLVVVVVLILVAMLLVVMVLPKIVEMFEELGGELPLMTRLLIGIGTVIREYPFAVATAILAAIITMTMFYRTVNGKYFMHSLFLRIPVFGQLIKEYNQARFFRALRTLFGSGVSLYYSVEVARKTMRNVVYQGAIVDIGPALVHGAPLSEALNNYPQLFDIQTRRMLEVGEQAGKYDDTFDHLTRFFERSVHHRVQTMNAILEPILVLLVGIVVGGIALSIFAPIYKVAEII